MTQEYSVSKENLQKVEQYFQMQSKLTEDGKISATVKDISENSGVALATAHKAIRELERKGIIKIYKPTSRRFAIEYVYDPENKIERTKEQFEDLIRSLEKENKELKDRLSFYEDNSDNIQVVNIDDDIEIIIKRKK
jgi:sugar-specific transcriptional regulator TrmB